MPSLIGRGAGEPVCPCARGVSSYGCRSVDGLAMLRPEDSWLRAAEPAFYDDDDDVAQVPQAVIAL